MGLNINIYYGGRGIIDDPALYVLNKMQEVLEELRVNVKRYNLYEAKNTIATLPQTLKDADGIILATTVEWYGIGGYMQQFLDACWLFGDKEKIAKIYMCPIVMSTTNGEREAKLCLTTAWEILGGLPCSGLCGYIENTIMLEMNEKYTNVIERKAENLYRTINQHVVSFPASNRIVKQKIAIPHNNTLTQQETEEWSRFVSDDNYVQRQKEDIQELTSLFRGMMKQEGSENTEEYLSEFQKAFRPQPGVMADYAVHIAEKPKALVLQVKGSHLTCKYDHLEEASVELQLNRAKLEEIVHGRMTFQRAFMSGDMKMKGDFSVLRMLDELFAFREEEN